MDWVNIVDLATKLILIPIGSYFVGKWFKSARTSQEQNRRKSRAQEIEIIARTGFDFVEALSKTKGWKGTEKWTEFVEYVSSAMLAQNMGIPSGKEMDWLKKYASGLSAIDKVDRITQPPRLPK